MIDIARRQGVAVATIDRPRLNLLDPAMIDALAQAFGAHDRGVPLVLTGAGEVFSAGVDVNAFGALERAGRAAFARAITRMTANLLAITAPVVAALPGHAMGGGLVLALCCDLRIAADNPAARFALSEAKAGVPFPSGPAEIIRHELPVTLLRRLTLTSTAVGAGELNAAGVFDALAPVGALQARALDAALEMAAQPAFGAVKRQVRGGLAERVAAAAAAGREPGFDPEPA